MAHVWRGTTAVLSAPSPSPSPSAKDWPDTTSGTSAVLPDTAAMELGGDVHLGRDHRGLIHQSPHGNEWVGAREAGGRARALWARRVRLRVRFKLQAHPKVVLKLTGQQAVHHGFVAHVLSVLCKLEGVECAAEVRSQGRHLAITHNVGCVGGASGVRGCQLRRAEDQARVEMQEGSGAAQRTGSTMEVRLFPPQASFSTRVRAHDLLHSTPTGQTRDRQEAHTASLPHTPSPSTMLLLILSAFARLPTLPGDKVIAVPPTGHHALEVSEVLIDEGATGAPKASYRAPGGVVHEASQVSHVQGRSHLFLEAKGRREVAKGGGGGGRKNAVPRQVAATQCPGSMAQGARAHNAHTHTHNNNNNSSTNTPGAG